MLSLLQASATTTTMTLSDFSLSMGASIVFGMIVAAVYMFRNSYTKSFVVTLALLPAMVQLVIMLVNGNLGAGVAVMGAFSLVRFRSIPGSAREIGSIFFAMAIGLATGMGYILIAGVFLVAIGFMTLLLQITPFGEIKTSERELKITVPENLDYEGLFDDVLSAYTESYDLSSVRTTNMGSLFELQYRILLKKDQVDKAFIDAIRIRNGNLSVSCSKVKTNFSEL